MSKARVSPLRSGFVHLALAGYTVIALFPVLLTILNSFKDRNAIFRTPLAPPTANTFSLVGYETVLKQGDFVGYFQNSLIVTVVSIFFVLLFGAMAGRMSGRTRRKKIAYSDRPSIRPAFFKSSETVRMNSDRMKIASGRPCAV